jgi:hypothetical protein
MTVTEMLSDCFYYVKKDIICLYNLLIADNVD